MKIKIKSVLLTIILAVFSNLIHAQDESPADPVASQEQEVRPTNAESPQENQNLGAPEVTKDVPKEETVPENIANTEDKNSEAPEVKNEITSDQKPVDNPTNDTPKENLEAVEGSSEKPVAIKTIEDTLLFRFMQDFAFLEAAAKSIDRNEIVAVNISEREQEIGFFSFNSEKVKALPFADLNKKLYAKLIELAENETLPLSDLDPRAGDEQDCWTLFLRSNPNLSDLFILFTDLSIKKRFCIDNDINFRDEIQSIVNSKDSLQSEIDVLKIVFAEVFSDYADFLNKNSEVLQKIEQFLKDTVETQCVKYKNKDFCTKNAKRTKLKSLRELMERVQNL